MKPLIRSFLLPLAIAAVAACYPVSDALQTITRPAKSATTPALRTLPTQSYPGPYPTSTRMPLPYPGPPPAEDAGVTAQLPELGSFLATRAAELNVPELNREQLNEAFESFEATRKAAEWQRLDEQQLQRLSLAWEPTLQIQPGETYPFAIGLLKCCYYFEEYDVQASWSVSPTVGATIDPQTGFFTVDEHTPPGTVYTVTADVENGRVSPTIDVYIYTLQENPLVGSWREEKQLTCPGEEEIVPETMIEELKFDADGTFSATWLPFERYKDYWGTYDYDQGSAKLILTIEDGNYVPADLDGTGFATMDAAQRLLLKEMWLGTRPNAAGGTNCGHVFVRNEY